jgi:8-oxo-dGTP diphosphatase
MVGRPLVSTFKEAYGRVLRPPARLRHPDSAYAPSEYHFLAGHCERESAVAGLVIRAEDVELVHAVHVLDAPGRRPRL